MKIGENQYIAISVSAEKVTAPIPIPKFGIGYGSRYRYRISLGHYLGYISLSTSCSYKLGMYSEKCTRIGG